MNEQLRKKRETHYKSLAGRYSYAQWAWENNRWSKTEAILHILRFCLLPWLMLEPLRVKWRRWQRKDRREHGYGDTKYAINRDGDLYLVICPNCGWQNVDFDTAQRLFQCPYSTCSAKFRVYTEDGVVKLVDHRRGEIRLPAIAVYDPGCKVYRLGVVEEAPWWWSRREVWPDLKPNGMDAHGHHPYEIVSIGQEEPRNLPEQADKVQ